MGEDLGFEQHKSYVEAQLRDLAFAIVEAGLVPNYKQDYAEMYGVEFRNGIFEMHPEGFNECSCDFDPSEFGSDHAPDCRGDLPNFRCGNIDVTWYKYIGRSMGGPETLSRQQWRRVFQSCHNSLKNQN